MGCLAKRPSPKDVPDISFNGVRYSVVHWAYLNGQKHNGGYVEALEESTNKKIWGKRIYKTDYGWFFKIEEDAVDVFITLTQVNESENALIVTNEKNEKYSLNLKTQKVTKL